jgi:hypothetical protein
MNYDKTLATLGATFFVILCLIGSVFRFLNMGSYFGTNPATKNT